MAALGDNEATIVPFSPAEPQMVSSAGTGPLSLDPARWRGAAPWARSARAEPRILLAVGGRAADVAEPVPHHSTSPPHDRFTWRWAGLARDSRRDEGKWLSVAGTPMSAEGPQFPQVLPLAVCSRLELVC